LNKIILPRNLKKKMLILKKSIIFLGAQMIIKLQLLLQII